MNFDVFLSHSSRDKDVVRELAHRLHEDGLKVWFDEWEVRPGEHIYAAVERGLLQSQVLVLAVSRNGLGSEWVTFETGTFRFRDPMNRELRFVPLLLDDADVPDDLRPFAYVDWRGKADS